MRRTALSCQTWLKRDGAGDAWRGRAPSKPPRPDASDGPNRVSIPAALAFQTCDGLAYNLRRVTPADVGPLAEFVRGLSDRTRWLRFMTARPCSPEFVRAEVARMAAGAAGDSITLIVNDARGGSGAVAAVAELACDRESRTGEVGVVVMDDAQRKGIGSLLLRQVLQIAQELGLAQLHGDMLAENYAMRRLIQALRVPYTATIQAGDIHIIVQVPQ
jgi:RimJ/RimL family protein N-acetyltransferase